MERLRRTPRPTLVGITAVFLFVVMAFGYWANVGDDDKEVLAWVIVCTIGSLIAAALLLRFVPATEAEVDGNAPARRGLVLGVVAAVTLFVFWTGLPIALGVPALVLGAEGHARSATYGQRPEAIAGMLFAAFAIVVASVALISGA